MANKREDVLKKYRPVYSSIDRSLYEGDNEGLIHDHYSWHPCADFSPDEGKTCFLCESGKHGLCQLTIHISCRCFRNNHEEAW